MILFKHSRLLCCLMPSFGVSTTSPKNSSSFHISPTSAIIFIKSWNHHHMKNNIRYKGNINNTSVTIFYPKVDSTKLPAMVLAWDNLQEVFVILTVLVFGLTGGFSFHGFSTSSLTLPWAIATFLHPFYTFSPAHCRVICDTFILTFLGFSFLPRVLWFWVTVLYPWVFFTLHSFVLWLRWGQEHPIQDLPLCLPSQSCPFRQMHGLELLMFELKDHWFINCTCATKYRVKIELLNMLCLFKVLCKDY